MVLATFLGFTGRVHVRLTYIQVFRTCNGYNLHARQVHKVKFNANEVLINVCDIHVTYHMINTSCGILVDFLASSDSRRGGLTVQVQLKKTGKYYAFRLIT